MDNPSKRENRVIRALINCVRNGEYTFDYATVLIEDEAKYGWMSSEVKEMFYSEFETEEE